MSFATGFKRETECFEGTVDLTGGEKSGGYWLGEKGEAGSGGVRGLRRVFTRSERRRVQAGSTAGKLPWVLHRELSQKEYLTFLILNYLILNSMQYFLNAMDSIIDRQAYSLASNQFYQCRFLLYFFTFAKHCYTVYINCT